MRILRFLSILSVLPLAVECGLPRPYYLEPPRANYTGGTSPFSISYSGENGFDEFKGYEFYYRFYTTQNWSDYTGQTKETLESYHFLPLCSPSDLFAGRTVVHSRPLVSITSLSVKQSSFTVTIDLSDPTKSPQITASLSGVLLPTPTTVMRSAATASQIKIFTPLSTTFSQIGYNLYEYLDPDMTNGDSGGTLGIPTSAPSTVYLAVYALSYGVFEGNPTYSTCVNLGYSQWSGSPAITVY